MVGEHSIWTEKYRPKSFSEVKGQKAVVEKVKAFVEQKNMPHLMFSGPAGVGKTTISLVIVRELFGESWRTNFLELNASDERGIDIIRNKVKDFARTRAIGNVPFKVIYLDECDALTSEAQQALRRTMENYAQTCRFILSCNYSSKIIDPIQSRCAIFRFKPLAKEDLLNILDVIQKEEGIQIEENAKIKDAYCEAGVVEDNGVLAFIKTVIMTIKQDKKQSFVIERPEKFGGNISFKTYSELEKAFKAKKVHPLDLKGALSKEINKLLEPIRKQSKVLNELAKAAYQ